MKKSSFILFVFLFLPISSFSKESKKIIWEYKAKTFQLLGDNILEKQLNKVGKEHWEIVSCPVQNATIVCIFKRPHSK